MVGWRLHKKINTPVADRLGHTDVAFTMNTYVHLFAEQRREGAFGIADLSEDGEETSNGSDEDAGHDLPNSSEDPEVQDELGELRLVHQLSA